MSKSFTCFLGTAVMLLTLGVITQVTGNPRLSAVCYVLGAITGVFSILLLINPSFFRNLHGFGVAWLVSAACFGTLAYYLKKMGAEYETMIMVFAGISALSAISAIGHGIYPNSQRNSSLVTLALDPILFVVITCIALSGVNAPVEVFKEPIADQMLNLPQQEFGVIDTMIGITVSIFKGNPVEVNGVMPFPHLFLLLHMIWNFLKVMRSYSYWFLCSCLTIPFVIVIWVKHMPREFGPPVYTMIGISTIVVAVFSVSLYKHWKVPATS